MSNLQLDKLKSGMKDTTEKTLKVSSNVVGDSNDENKFSYKFLITDTQVLHKRGEPWGILGRVVGPLLKAELTLIGNVLKPLAKCILTPLGLTTAASGTGAAIHEKRFAFDATSLIISNEEMKDIVKIIKSLEESGLLIKRVSKTIKNEAKEQKGGFFGMLFGSLGATLLANLITGKSTGKGTIIIDHNF